MGDYLAWDPTLPYPGTSTGDPAADLLSRGVPPGYVVQLYGPAFPAPPNVGPLTEVPPEIATLIGSGGPYYVVGASLAQHFDDESHIITVQPTTGPSWFSGGLPWLLLGAGVVVLVAMTGGRR